MPLALKNGDTLRTRYRVRERIGQGGMGNIYLADDLRLEGRRCALKEVEYDRRTPGKILREARDQFLREATILARLDHPNLPKVSDYFSVGRRDYLVMDYVPGKDLRTLMMEARGQNIFLAEGDVLGWAGQLISALTYLHGQDPQVVHRDIKPSNLKITPDNLLKLVDFGLVKVLTPDEVTVTVIQGRGTALYTPLEQYGDDGQHTDARSDIYALGATLYHILTNQPPPDARQRFLYPDILTLPRKINPSISARTEQAILWAMELHPNDRPENVEILQEYLSGKTGIFGRQIKAPALSSGLLQKLPMKKTEMIMLWIAGGFLLISLLASLLG